MNRRIVISALSALLLTGVSALAQSSSWTIDHNHTQVNGARLVERNHRHRRVGRQRPH
jgi:hypothetical protein